MGDLGTHGSSEAEGPSERQRRGLNPTKTRQRKPQTRAFLQRVWRTGILREFELPKGGWRVRRFTYDVLDRALAFRRDFLLWPGQDSEQDDRAVLHRVAGFLMEARWDDPSVQRTLSALQTLLGIGAVVEPGERAPGETHPSLWHVAEQRYIVHRPVRKAIAHLEADPTFQPYVERAREQLRQEAANARDEGEQLRKELAEGNTETGAAKLRDLVRAMRAEGNLPRSKPPDKR